MSHRITFRAGAPTPAWMLAPVLAIVLAAAWTPAICATAAAAAAAAAATTATTAAAAAIPSAARQPAVTLCFESQDVLPWRTRDGAGLNFALLNMMAQRLGVTLDFQSMPWKRCLQQLRDNTVDGAFAVSYKADRRELGEFPGGERIDADKRMHIDRYVLIRKKGSSVDWDGKAFRNLDGAIGFQLGYSVGDMLRGQHVEVDEGSQRADELARKVIAGRLAGAAIGGSDAAGLMRGPLAPQLEQVAMPLIEKPYFLILSHALVASRPALANGIWRAIEQSRNSPAYRKLEHEATLPAARDHAGARH